VSAELGSLRIGELSRRSGVSPELLRAWERRYGLLQPERTPGGFRLYTPLDEARVRAMQANLKRGLSAAEAARLALREVRPEPPVPLEPAPEGLADDARRLREGLDRFDEGAAHAALDRLLAAFSLELVLRDVVVTYLHELGERWARGETSIGQEHFASNVLRGRLLALARGWGYGAGPAAVLACPPGEQHDLALIVFGLTLRGRGWRITYLGPDAPVATIAEAARAVRTSIIVVAAAMEERFDALAVAELSALAREFPLALAGEGATPEVAETVGARLLRDDPVTEAARLTPAGVA
jgi:DNA-binding transcriptional MerR regulator